MTLILGQVVFDGDTPDVDRVLLTVRLEDVSLAGMRTTIVAVHQREVDLAEDDSLRFEILPAADSPVINPRSSYAVTAHVSLHPDEQPEDIMQGDYLTVQSYPVLTQGNPSIVTVEVKLIR